MNTYNDLNNTIADIYEVIDITQQNVNELTNGDYDGMISDSQLKLIVKSLETELRQYSLLLEALEKKL